MSRTETVLERAWRELAPVAGGVVGMLARRRGVSRIVLAEYAARLRRAADALEELAE